MANWMPITSGISNMLDNYAVDQNLPIRVGPVVGNTGALSGFYMVNPEIFICCPEWKAIYHIFVTGGTARTNNGNSINASGGNLIFSNGSGTSLGTIIIFTGNTDQFKIL